MKLSNCRSGGYVDWTREQDFHADLQARREFATRVIEEAQEGKLNEAVIQIGLAQLYHVLAAYDRDTAEGKLRDDPASPRVLLTVRGKGYMFAGSATS